MTLLTNLYQLFFKKKEENIDAYGKRVREKLNELNKACTAISNDAAEKAVLRKNHERMAIKKFEQNILNNEIRIMVSSATKASLDEAIALALEKELLEKTSNVKKCNFCNIIGHMEVDCRKKQSLLQANMNKNNFSGPPQFRGQNTVRGGFTNRPPFNPNFRNINFNQPSNRSYNQPNFDNQTNNRFINRLNNNTLNRPIYGNQPINRPYNLSNYDNPTYNKDNFDNKLPYGDRYNTNTTRNENQQSQPLNPFTQPNRNVTGFTNRQTEINRPRGNENSNRYNNPQTNMATNYNNGNFQDTQNRNMKSFAKINLTDALNAQKPNTIEVEAQINQKN